MSLPVPSPVAPRSVAASLFEHRHGSLILFYLLFVGVSLATRALLLVTAAPEVAWDASLLGAFALGLVFDLGAAALASLPLLLALTVLPAGFFQRAWARLAAYAVAAVLVYAILFGAAAEWFFWEEFGARFNFIAVDYLVYTTEVVGNIRESYNLPLLLVSLGGATLAGLWLIQHSGLLARSLHAAPEPAKRRYARGAGLLAATLLLALALDEERLPAFANNYNRELAKDGLWSLFAAFQNNVLDYDQFYRTLPLPEAFAQLKHEMGEDRSVTHTSEDFDTLHLVTSDGPELRPNVIQITVESLSADFLGIFNRASGLTPNLTEIAGKSLVFDNFYATGTRTDRGMEALTLSLPPTPGRSMIKRPRNEGMFTLGSVFQSKGYDTAFIYGGFGYFDNMNYFFGHNGYRVIDRSSVAKADVTFANVWGACDEDLYRWALREADAAHAAGKPFHHFVMTTSNHRPYTFPEGKIDLPSKTSGRAGAVKYSDFAIGQFLRAAADKPWYRNTVFVIVADHCASSAGKTELPVQNYHIPLLVFAPGGHIAPGHITTLTSQMDYAPTLLGLLNWSYPSRFFGHDVRRTPEDDAHALVGNYQKLGHLEKGEMAVLQPQRRVASYRYDLRSGALVPDAPTDYAVREAIAYYQPASYLYRNGLYRAVAPADSARLGRGSPLPSGGE